MRSQLDKMTISRLFYQILGLAVDPDNHVGYINTTVVCCATLCCGSRLDNTKNSNHVRSYPMLRTHVRPLVVGIAFATAATTGYTQQLEEVVVTAQKREQTLSEVPISLSAISGELVQDAAIKSFQELGQYVPNLSITENAVNSIISMRGILRRLPRWRR